MKGATVNAHTFMTRTANHSTKGSRRGFVDVNTGVCPTAHLTTREIRDNLLRARQAAVAMALDPETPLAKRREMGQRIYSLNLKMEKLKKKFNKDGFPSIFVEMARRTMEPDAFGELLAAAQAEWDKANDWPALGEYEAAPSPRSIK